MSAPTGELHIQLTEHAKKLQRIHMRDLFEQYPHRATELSIELPDLFIDYSKNIVIPETLELLLNYARSRHISNSIAAMFSGDKINHTEQRSVLHIALRSPSQPMLKISDTNITKQVHQELEKIKQFTTVIHTGQRRGWSRKPFNTFVNIGIGGSNLGPKLAVDALSTYRIGDTKSFFISGVDYQRLARLLKAINLEQTLFIVSSKSFTTSETMLNTASIKRGLIEAGCDNIEAHFVAVTANAQAALDAGYAIDNIFHTWDWVGGRFSLWSAVGLPIALAIGFDNFHSLLQGAHAMDEHFKQTPLANNAPVIMALLDFWYSNYMSLPTHAIIPYDESLRYLPAYLAQLFMESNGKSLDTSGKHVAYTTSPIIWGDLGIDSQHAFFQLLHQGTQVVPIDFLMSLSSSGDPKHHALLFSSCVAQSQALMQGDSDTEKYSHCVGNKPSTVILYPALTAQILGALIALYEHRAFILGLLWNINSFDQYGVELGKQRISEIHASLNTQKTNSNYDTSTQNLISRYKKYQ